MCLSEHGAAEEGVLERVQAGAACLNWPGLPVRPFQCKLAEFTAFAQICIAAVIRDGASINLSSDSYSMGRFPDEFKASKTSSHTSASTYYQCVCVNMQQKGVE